MIGGKHRISLTPKSVLDRISSYDIFRYYMPNKNWKVNEVTLSPFRNEKNPSFIISNKSNHHLFYKDFGDMNYKGDCFTFVKQLYAISSLYEVLKKIDADFGLGIYNVTNVKDYKKMVESYSQPEVTKSYSFIQAVTRKFTNRELEYWNSYHQSLDDLKLNNVYAIKKVYLNRQLILLKDVEMVFGYLYDNHWKIYKPFADKKVKWVPNNTPIDVMDGKENIIDCDVAFIAKSKKDYMVMKKIHPCCCSVQNEGIGCFTKNNVDYLKSNSKRQILGFDSDVPGVTSSKQITKLFDFEYCNVPKQYLTEGIKDFADWAKIYGLKTVQDYLKEKNIIA
jgi:hypothetical protein